MHGAFAFRLALAAFFCRAAFAGEEPAVEKKARAATHIYVRTAPPGASVRLDGKDEGTAPGIFVVPPGVAKLTVEVALDGVTESRVVEVRGGKITRVEFELAREQRRTTGTDANMREPASVPPPPAEAADGDAIRAVIAKFAALVRSGRAGEAIRVTDMENPAEQLSRLLAMRSARGNLTDILDAEILGLVVDKNEARALAYGKRKPGGALAFYGLLRRDGEWRIRTLAVADGSSDAIGHGVQIDGRSPPRFDVTLEFVLPDPERRHAELLDLDTGVFAAMEEFGADDRVTHKWVRDHGMDALGVNEKGTAGVLLFDVATIDIPPEKWGAITLREIADHKILKQKEPDKITSCVCQPSLPVPTCIFRTREGSLGVLQVLGESETPKGVKIRYRLARVPGGASSEQPEARARRFVRLVVGADAMTFQGAPVSWEELPKLLDAVPDRSRTVLELGAASAELPMARMNEVMARLQVLVRELGFEYVSLVGVQPLESKGTATVLRGRLDFRLAPMREEGKMLGLAEGDIERYTAEFNAKGPVPATYGKDPFAWCRLAQGVAPHVRGISAERDGRSYVLLSNRPAETMLTLWGEANPWRLLDATRTLLAGDAPDRPSIALRLDKEGGWRMGVLTEAHVGLPLAALVDDEVLSLPTIRAKAGDAIVITGAFTREEAAELVERLKGGVSR